VNSEQFDEHGDMETQKGGEMKKERSFEPSMKTEI
jgi:hypothetical protein